MVVNAERSLKERLFRYDRTLLLKCYKGVGKKKCNIRICISNTPTFYALQMNFRGRFFSAVYHPQGVRDEKVSSALAHLEHGECDGIATELMESRRISDGFFVRVLSG